MSSANSSNEEYLKKSNLLTINKLATVCSTSRSTILRMEQIGILKPAYINPENGYRYYDEKSVLRILRNISFQQLGITQKEISAYYNGNQHYEYLLQKLEKKLMLLENYLVGLRAQLGHESHLANSDYSFPEQNCYTERLSSITDTSVIRSYMWTTFENAVYSGYSIDSQMHPFISINADEFLRGDFSRTECDYTICIPILKPQKSHTPPPIVKPADFTTKEIPAITADILHYDSCNTISTLLYGGSHDIKEAFIRLGKYIQEHSLIPCGDARIIAIVQSYPGEDIPMEYWVSRVCIPVTHR